MVNCTEFLKKRLCCFVSGQPKKAVSYAWAVSLVSAAPPSGTIVRTCASLDSLAPPPLSYTQGLVAIAFIVACVSAAQMASANAPAGKAAGFAAVWTALLLVVISVLGTMVLRRWNKALSVGVLMGIIFVMVQQMLILFAFFAERSTNPGQVTSVVASQQAMAVFSFFIFLVYASFGLMLAVFRVDFIKAASEEAPQEVEDDEHAGQDVSKAEVNFGVVVLLCAVCCLLCVNLPALPPSLFDHSTRTTNQAIGDRIMWWRGLY